ncbi:MAG: hypothetical protein EKK64_00390 [Neisseriaceae bacterium]|nr:MAG: hypothetical protein EKK64_00390 [Neisseriaceae bacterium]
MIEQSQIQKINFEFYQRINQNASPKKIKIPSIFKEICDCDPDAFELGFGKFGLDLKDFIDKIDLSHPEIDIIFDGILSDDETLSKNFIELINLAKLAKKNNLNKILPLLSKDYIKDLFPKSLVRKIESPSKLYLRMLKDSDSRMEVRQTKRMQNIDLQSLYSKGDYFWQLQPNSFTKFLRFDNSYLEDLRIAEKKAAKYKELGCSFLYEEINKSIESFKEIIKDNHFGFNRITMTNAAVILAKSLGFNFSSQEKVNNFGNIRIESEITVNRNLFEGFNFGNEDSIEYDFCLSKLTKNHIFSSKKMENCCYQPRIYPLHEFMDLASTETKDSIAVLEKFPEASYKPIFDHFGIIIPSISLEKDENGLYSFSNNGISYCFENKEDAEKSLDLILVKKEYLPSIIVGDKDGKCYFLSYFNVKKLEN